MKKKKLFGVPSVELPDVHIIVVSIIFILIFPIAALITYKVVGHVDDDTEKVEIVVEKEETPIALPQECAIVE